MDEPTYLESLKIGWMLLWRGIGSFLALLMVLNQLVLSLTPELTRTEPSLWASFLPLLTAAAVSLFIIMPILVRSLLHKRFRGFEVRLIRR